MNNKYDIIIIIIIYRTTDVTVIARTKRVSRYAERDVRFWSKPLLTRAPTELTYDETFDRWIRLIILSRRYLKYTTAGDRIRVERPLLLPPPPPIQNLLYYNTRTRVILFLLASPNVSADARLTQRRTARKTRFRSNYIYLRVYTKLWGVL